MDYIIVINLILKKKTKQLTHLLLQQVVMSHLIYKKWQHKEFVANKGLKGFSSILITVTANKLATISGSRVSLHT